MAGREDVTQTVVVCDTGTGTVKAGFAGNATPAEILPCVIGTDLKGPYVGHEAEAVRGIVKLRNPVDRGLITDWDNMEKIWAYTFYETLRIAHDQYQFLLTEPPLNPKANREKMTQIMFESFDSSALYIANQSVLSLFATGRTTGIVMDSGEGTSDVVPIYEGFSLPHAVVRSHVAGGDLTDYLMRILADGNYAFTPTYGRKIIRDVKEKLSYVALDYDQETETAKNSCVNYEMPDGQFIAIGSERFRCTEPLFDPAVLGSESIGIHQIFGESVIRSDADIKQDLYGNIVLSGGTTMCPGFSGRLNKEISRLTATTDLKIRTIVPPERKFGAWIGGSILASLETFPKMCVWKVEYEEYGPGVVHRKCF